MSIKSRTLIQKRKTDGKEKKAYLEAAEDSSSSQFLICLTLRLKIAADCLTSLLSKRTTALTPATVNMKFIKAIFLYPNFLLQRKFVTFNDRESKWFEIERVFNWGFFFSWKKLCLELEKTMLGLFGLEWEHVHFFNWTEFRPIYYFYWAFSLSPISYPLFFFIYRKRNIICVMKMIMIILLAWI